MVSSEQRQDLDTTQLTVRLTKLIRATERAADKYQRDSVDFADDTNYYRFVFQISISHFIRLIVLELINL